MRFSILMHSLLFLILSFNAHAAAKNSCASTIGSCDYYLCRESMKSCGDEGYNLRFGYKYCDNFMNEVIRKLSPHGQQWMPKVAACLQEKMEKISLKNSCEKIETLAIQSHSSCYQKTGWCELSWDDQWEVMKTMLPVSLNPMIQREFFEIQNACSAKSR